MSDDSPEWSVDTEVTDDRRLAGVLLCDGAPYYVCPHNHATTDLAQQCAGRKRTEVTNAS